MTRHSFQEADPPLDPVAVAESYGSTAGPWADLNTSARTFEPDVARRGSSEPDCGPFADMTAAQPTPVAVTNRGWSIGDAGRAFAEVEPVLGDLNEGPDTMADGGVVGSVHVLAASVRGLSHRQQGTPRQDSYGFAVTADRRWLVLTVADGVSAGRLSHRAAQLVTRYGPGLVAAEIDREGAPWNVPWYEIFQQLAGRIISVGQKLLAAEGIPDATPQGVSDAMATTVTVVVMELAPVEGTRRVAVAWQGDSPVWLVYRDEWRCLTEVKNLSKELASSSVMALPRLPSDPDMLRHTATMVPLDATLLVMTDGVGDPLGTADGDVAAALAEAWHTPPTVFRFAEQVAFGRKSFDDDRTVVAVWPRTAS